MNINFCRISMYSCFATKLLIESSANKTISLLYLGRNAEKAVFIGIDKLRSFEPYLLVDNVLAEY